MKTAMNTGKPKVWDKQKRTYEKRELWKKITIRECLTKYYNMGAQELGLEIREVVGKELKLQEIMDE
jgi:hypothetical protein